MLEMSGLSFIFNNVYYHFSYYLALIHHMHSLISVMFLCRLFYESRHTLLMFSKNTAENMH